MGFLQKVLLGREKFGDLQLVPWHCGGCLSPASLVLCVTPSSLCHAPTGLPPKPVS